ncbi:MAG TPA: aspartate aminotransferase family protein [Bacteroidales bacterium]|nr:aspartate aminotransferase family protein [Bacteroidales bacterium]
MNHRELFYHFLGQTSDFPLAIEVSHAHGVYLYTPTGKRYLDIISGIGVSNLGHGHPEVIAAVKHQVDKYMHLMVYGELVQSPQVLLAQKLVELLPDSLNNVYLVNSGAEATEGALKLAKRFTGRTEIVSFRHAYHGSTHGALSIGGSENLKQAFRPLLPGITIIDYNCYEQLKAITRQTACVVVETIQGEAGVMVPNAGYLNKLRQQCDQTGTLLVFDEIQCGFGRTGKLWAFEHFGVVPDILLLAKSMGGGLPIGAFIASKQIMRSLTHSPVLGHITTFGGNPVCAAAALAHITVVQRDRLWEQVPQKEQLFREQLKHNQIVEIRGMGLMLAIVYENAPKAQRVIARCLEEGLLTDWFLFADNCLRIAPPLIISNEQIREACEIILKASDA